jgi:chitin-binding protein
MRCSRTVAAAGALVTTVLAGAVGVVAPAVPAAAHGATSDPPSRAVTCAPDAGRTARSAACRAAVAATGSGFEEWDNVRVAGVDGRDRAVIPDGRICGGGLDDFRGLDLARTDWPATRVSPGTRFTFRYRQRIPHKGTFRLYVTRPGYDPARPLRWADLPAKPFLTATDPPMRGDAYVFAGRLPAGRTGRHVLLAIWQNSDTADTYYSCSDVVFGAGAAPAPGGTTPPRTTPPRAGPPGATPTGPGAASGTSAERAEAAFGAAPAAGPSGPLLLAGGSAAVAAVAVAGALLARRRRRR